MTEVSIKDISKIIEEFKYVPYESYVKKRYKHMPTESYFYPTRQLAKFMMSNSRVSARTKNMSTQKMSNLRGSVRTQKTSMKNMSNPRGCSTDDIISKRVNINEI